jgi:hypothetical protein
MFPFAISNDSNENKNSRQDLKLKKITCKNKLKSN